MGKWQNIPPDQKPNWHRMNEGQRRYAYEQYNLALVRRGLNINHPVPENQGEYNHRGDFNIDEIINRPHPDEQQIAREIDDDTGDIDPSAEEVLANLPNAPEDPVEEFDESLFESDSEGFGNSRNSNMADSSVSTPKRGPEDQAGNASKRLFQDGGSMKLPGTARDQGASGNNLGEDSVRPFKIPKPIVSIQNNVQYFRKVHRFFTYGYGYKSLPLASVPGLNIMTTPLALVPWDWLFLYLNPSEFALLPNQASVKHVKVSVYQRNVRVAFSTNATDTRLATLNQNKNIVFARALNKKMDCMPVLITPTNGNPMLPSGVAEWTPQTFIDDNNNWYGSQANTSGAEPVTPRHQFGQPDNLYTYAGIAYRTTPGSPNHDGWECFQTHVEETDADASSGGLLVEMNYSPRIGLCKPPKKVIERVASGQSFIPRGSHNLEAHGTTLTMSADGTPTATTSTISAKNQNFTTLNTNVQLIEKCQTFHEGLFLHDTPQVQPSLHIGVQPTYAITTTNQTINSSFTDTQALFEVVAEAWVDTNSSTFRPLTLQSNVQVGNMWTRNVGDIIYNRVLIDGLYRGTT